MSSEPLKVPMLGGLVRYETSRAGILIGLLRLGWFTRLRWGFVAAAVLLLAAERWLFPTTQRPPELRWTVLAVAAVNLVWMLVTRLVRHQLELADAGDAAALRAGQWLTNAQIGTDLFLLTAILHYSGGVENPMSVFYIFHVAISALLLTTRQAVLQSCWAAGLYAATSVGELSGRLAHYEFLPQFGVAGLYDQADYALLVTAIQSLAIFATLYFTLRIAWVLDRRRDELLRANAALEQSRQAIQDLQNRRTRFMRTAAHQLKSPLAMAQTLANLIREGLVTDREAIYSTCEKITRRCQEGITQLSELLTLARVQEADPARHARSRVDVEQVVAELCRRFRPLAERKQIELTCWTPRRGDLLVNVDAHDLSDCIGNLIDNAIKYTTGPGKVRVAVTSKVNAGRPEAVSIHVSDTGMGFDPALLHSEDKKLGGVPVFDAFRRGPNVMAAGIPGSGLGLSIVREVVEQAGGRIWVISRPGAGTSFTVTLPIHGADRPTVRDTRAAEVLLEGAATTGSGSAGQSSDAG